MKHPKFFVFVLLVVSFFLLLFVFPNGFVFKFKEVSIPFTKIKISLINPSKIDINLGFVRVKKEFAYRLGLDLQGGTRIVYSVDMKEIPKKEQALAFESVRTVIERRINFFGVTEPTIQSLKLTNDYRIIVELPGSSNTEQAVELIGKTAQLSFWEEGKESLSEDEKKSFVYPLGLTQIYTKKPVKTKLTGRDLKKSSVVYGSQDGTPQVQLTFSNEGTKLFAEITKRNVSKPVAIVLDDITISAPVVQQAILNGNAVISGKFTQELAKQLSIQLNAGALPAPLKIIGQTTVGPSLGIISLKNSLFGGALGFLSIMLFMLYLYRKEGVLASIALLIYAIITLSVFKFIPITLTLAGVAGFVLSIGMAVDANILIFERMKEERRLGKPKNIAVKLGFQRAWTSIRDSNISSIITCVILFYFGSGIVRGFALTLFIGIVISMFSAIVVTRNLLSVFDKK